MRKWTCGECYTIFDLPEDMRCPTCKIREIVPVEVTEEQLDKMASESETYGNDCPNNSCS